MFQIIWHKTEFPEGCINEVNMINTKRKKIIAHELPCRFYSQLFSLCIFIYFKFESPYNSSFLTNCFFQFAGGYNHLRSPVCQDESQRDETSPPPHSHSTQPPTSHSSTPNSNNNNNNNNNANNAYIHLRNLNQLKTECKLLIYVV